MVSINDRYVQYWLNQEFGSNEPIWIGLNYNAESTGGKYLWSNMEKFTFDHWDRNNPSNHFFKMKLKIN